MKIRELYDKTFQRLSNLDKDIHIEEVSDEVIKLIDENISSGFYTYSKIVKGKIILLIDKTVPLDLKICVLFHEYGHAKHLANIGEAKANALQQSNFSDWQRDSEYEAIKFQIFEIHNISVHGECEDVDLFKEMMVRLDDRRQRDTNLNYRKAIEKLYNEEPWISYRNSIKP